MARQEEEARRKALEGERQEILSQLQGLRESIQIEIDTDPEEGDPDLHEREKNLTLIAALENELAKVETALEAVKRGTYGICERCSQIIDPERLEVRPEATLCVKCQAEVERLIRRGLMRPSSAREDILEPLEEEA